MDKGIEKRRITQPAKRRYASGGPGAKPRWTSGAKTMVGTAQSVQSGVWFTVNNGVLAEVYFPDVDQANTRVVRFLITGEDGFFSDELWDAEHHVGWLAEGVPGCAVTTTCKRGRYTIHKEIFTDPLRDILLLRVRFVPAPAQKLRLYLTADVHMGDQGAENHAWAGEYKGTPMLFACRDQLALAISIDPSPLAMSVGYVGKNDGYTALAAGKPLPETNMAEPGNVAVAAEIDLQTARCHDLEAAIAGPDGASSFVVALAFGRDPAEAGQHARAGTQGDSTKTRDLFVQQWQRQQGEYMAVEDLGGGKLDMYRVSTAMLASHQSKRFPGGFVASLSLPWGFTRTDKDVGGYHVVWPRDLVEAAMGKLASGDACSARSALFYLACTQGADGGWSQNMWLDGTPHWTAVQMDGIALPVLLADKLRRDDALDGYDPKPMMNAAARFVLRHGPVTGQDRWETTPGYSPYTMAVQVAALLAGADCADLRNDPGQARFLRETADAWNDAIDELTYVRGTALAKQHGVEGHYVRAAPPERIEHSSIGSLNILMPNRRFGLKHPRAVDIVSPDALALVRFGLRAADDPRVLDTVRVIDATLKRETATGPGWRRSTHDGYGETASGGPFEKAGIGRCWPLLAGERGHYEIAGGNHAGARELLKTMARQTSECGLLPEQVWDEQDMPKRELFSGRPTGSGMPLVWAHAEYIKLLRSLHLGAIWDTVPQTVERYVKSRHPADFQIWRPLQRRAYVTAGKDLRVDLDGSSRVSWKVDGTEFETVTADSGLGLHTARLPLGRLAVGTSVRVRVKPVEPGPGSEASTFTVRVQTAEGSN